jgi:AmmeMemoRadiSam system protein B
MSYVRAASHAGSWYTEDGAVLARDLDGWMAAARAPAPAPGRLRGVIAPHAGFRYSGATAGAAYAAAAPLPPGTARVFILGPSHHVPLDGLAVSGASEVATPVGALRVDAGVAGALVASSSRALPVRRLTRDEDEDEHSIEMHLPFVARAIAATPTAAAGAGAGAPAAVVVVPVVVGALTPAQHAAAGALLAPYLADDANFFVISSDFCHWGSRFRYTPLPPAAPGGPPPAARCAEFIGELDAAGMAAIEAGSAAGFTAYIADTRNTVCGRHPITVALAAAEALDGAAPGASSGAGSGAGSGRRHAFKFVKYAQSSAVRAMTDSSVSYASAVWTRAG